MNRFSFVDKELDRRHTARQMRKLRPLEPVSASAVETNNQAMLNFCSNDYLGLSKHPDVIARSREYLEKFGAGSTASRLICGTFTCADWLEKKLARLKQAESVLVMNSGFQANTTVIPALADKHSLILSDQLNHNSLIQGARLSKCKVSVYRHNDLDHLEELLAQHQGGSFSRLLIVTESVFSMDGDQSDVGALVTLAKKYNAILVVDEAHATGVLGENGMGLTCGKGVDVVIGTFGKALGAFGAYVACSDKLSQYLVNCCSGFIYSTALPPAVLGAVDAALDLVPEMEQQRRLLHNYGNQVRSALREMGWSTGRSSTQIIPVVIGGEEETLALSKYLEDKGILATAIRPPTVEKGASRIRIALSAAHTPPNIEQLLLAFQKWK